MSRFLLRTRGWTGPWVVCLLLTLISFSDLKSSEEFEMNPSSVWEIKGEKNTVYLAGSIHLMTADSYPLPGPFEAAYRNSSKVVFEVHPDTMTSPKSMQLIFKLGMYPPGQSLQTELSPKGYKKAAEFFKKKKMNLLLFQGQRPWVVSQVVSLTALKKLGADPAKGIDMYFNKRAVEDGYQRGALETVEFQVKTLAGLSKQTQEDMLINSIEEIDKVGEQFGLMVKAWRLGDMETLYDTMLKPMKSHGDLYEDLLVKRNRNWIPQIQGYLKEDQNIMVVVGTGHLSGPDSVNKMLEAKGIKLTRYNPQVLPPKKAPKKKSDESSESERSTQQKKAYY